VITKAGSARSSGLWNIDFARDVEHLGNLGNGFERLGRDPAPHVAGGDGDADAIDAALEQRHHRIDGAVRAHRIVGVWALYRVIGERQVTRRPRQRADMIEARHERERASARHAAVGRLQPVDAAERAGTRIEPLVSEPKAIGTRPR
jgi:hypothetical protein